MSAEPEIDWKAAWEWMRIWDGLDHMAGAEPTVNAARAGIAMAELIREMALLIERVQPVLFSEDVKLADDMLARARTMAEDTHD